jgi:hypothetical protein
MFWLYECIRNLDFGLMDYDVVWNCRWLPDKSTRHVIQNITAQIFITVRTVNIILLEIFPSNFLVHVSGIFLIKYNNKDGDKTNIKLIYVPTFILRFLVSDNPSKEQLYESKWTVLIINCEFQQAALIRAGKNNFMQQNSQHFISTRFVGIVRFQAPTAENMNLKNDS